VVNTYVRYSPPAAPGAERDDNAAPAAAAADAKRGRQAGRSSGKHTPHSTKVGAASLAMHSAGAGRMSTTLVTHNLITDAGTSVDLLPPPMCVCTCRISSAYVAFSGRGPLVHILVPNRG
jgi:hypothetical protein